MMFNKGKKILVFSDWFLPGYRAGGPIRSLANMVQSVDHHFYIVTRNTDHHSEVPYQGIQSDQWIDFSPNVKVYYFTESNISASAFRKIISEINPDKLYFNSLFSPAFTIKPLGVAVKLVDRHRIVLAPRGMLKPGALSVKPTKKKIFLLYAKMVGLFKGIVWHATNQEEIAEIKNMFRDATDIRFSANLPSLPPKLPTGILKQKGELRLICIARISPEKGILEAVKFLMNANLSGKVVCDFYGTKQNADYLLECEKAAVGKSDVTISFKGEIEPVHIPKTLIQYHFFYMATWGENFGHSIAEALNHGLPVVISDRTPWRNLHLISAGWDIPLNQLAFEVVLKICLSMDNQDYQEMRKQAHEHGATVASDPKSIEDVYRLFE
jgi:glycosyltransferase involved in cell wall biosynthesis